MTSNETTVCLLNQSVLERISVKGFVDFLKNNKPLVIAVSISVVFICGAVLIWSGRTMDEVLYLADPGNPRGLLSADRVGYVILVRLWEFIDGWEFNSYTNEFTAGVLLWCAALSWCYIIAVFSGNTGRDNRFIPFALLFSSSIVFAEGFLFAVVCIQNMLLQALCPYVVYLFYKGFLDNKKGKILFAFFALFFMMSVYQAVVLVFCCGVFLCFVLLQERTDFEPKAYSRLCLKLLIALLLAGAVYFIINRFIVRGLMQIEQSDHWKDPVKWLKRPFIENILTILMNGYILTIGNIPLVQRIAHPMIDGLTSLPDAPPVAKIAAYSRVYSNVLLLPAAILFLIAIAQKTYGIIPKGRRLLYVLAGIGVPFSIILLTVIVGTAPPYRGLWALPLAIAFMCFYLIKLWKKKAAYVLCLLALIVSARQMQTGAMLAYSEKMRSDEEVRLAVDLNRRIQEVQPERENLPVALIGSYDYQVPNLIYSQMVSEARTFSFNGSRTIRGIGLLLMDYLGFRYDPPGDRQWATAAVAAASMPSYPAPGCVQRLPDIVVVKLSDDENTEPPIIPYYQYLTERSIK